MELQDGTRWNSKPRSATRKLRTLVRKKLICTMNNWRTFLFLFTPLKSTRDVCVLFQVLQKQCKKSFDIKQLIGSSTLSQKNGTWKYIACSKDLHSFPFTWDFCLNTRYEKSKLFFTWRVLVSEAIFKRPNSTTIHNIYKLKLLHTMPFA